MRRTILLTLAALMLIACVGGNGLASQERSMDDEFTLPPGSGRPGSSPAKSLPPVERTLTGILSFDDIEGGCAFLLAPDGTRHEVVYPAGWSVDRLAGELRGPAGEVVPAGGTVTVTGRVARDRASICQIGPIFVATTVQP